MTTITTVPFARDSTGALQVDPELYRVLKQTSEALHHNGMGDIADRAWEVFKAPPMTPTVVVIGEVKRGKSSLVNALLGGREISPVDVDIATSAFLRFIAPAPQLRDGDAQLVFAGGRRRDVAVGDLRDWVTESGRYVTDSGIDELPIGAEVALVNDLLPDAILVDTPGVGGLNPSHLRLATESARAGSVLLMTCDVSAPICGPELEFLASVSAEIDTVVIAVTMIDKSPRDWRAIVEENRRLLAQHTRFGNAPIIGVSSVRACAAMGMDPGQERAETLADSGLLDLVGVLRRCASSGERLAAVNCLRIMRNGMDGAMAKLEARRLAIVGGEDAAADLDAESKRLEKLFAEFDEKARGGWRDFLHRDITKVRASVVETLEERLDGLRIKWRNRIESASKKQVRRQPQLLVAEATADLEVLVQEVSDRLAHEIEHLELEGGLRFTPDPLNKVGPAEDQARDVKAFNPQMMGMGMIGVTVTNLGGQAVAQAIGVPAAAAAGGAFLTTATLSLILLPVGIVLGGGWVAVNYFSTAVRMGRANLERWLNDAIGAVKRGAVSQVDQRINEIRPLIAEGIRCYFKDSIAELQQLGMTAKRAANASQIERSKAIGNVDNSKTWIVNTVVPALDKQLVRFATSANPSAGVGRSAGS